MKYCWVRKGVNTYEVSSKGDKNYSAFFARLRDGRTIEEAYQLDVKGYRRFSNNPIAGKGRPPLEKMTPEQLYTEYLTLWKRWARENPKKMAILRDKANQHDGILSDMFANTPCNQARALSDILNEKYGGIIK